MKEENRKYGQLAYDLVKDAENFGSRLPGSEGERKYADFMGKKLEEIGIKAKKEEFAVSPRSGIGGLPYAGWVGIILSVLTYFAFGNPSIWFLMGFIGISMVIWLIFSAFLYKPWFDMFFRH